ncbi:MAG TPA: membrane dipeptidase [Cytophagaceae bacterium]
MNKFIVDFHCHATLRALNTIPSNGIRNIWEKTYNQELPSKVGRWARFQTREIAKESQTNLYSYAQNNTRVVFDSLYPVEKNWFKIRKMPGYIVGDRAQEEIMLVAFGIEKKRLRQLKNHQDYFQELLECYEFLLNGQGCSPDEQYCYKLVRNYRELSRILKKEPHTIAIIITIEGAHALGSGIGDNLAPNHTSHRQMLSENICKIKEWEFPPFCINLAHHFWNQLSGHARSLKPPINLVFDQYLGLNTGITELGWHVVENLLTRNNGRRILIDIKHMSVQARKEYYRFVVTHNNLYPDDKIPIICSHTGVSAFETMDESIKVKDINRKSTGSYYNNWSINLSDEEIKIIYQSGGIIGVMLDKGVIAGPDTLKFIRSMSGMERKKAFLKLILDTVFHIVQVCEDKTGWDIICIGSDYDGLITHFDDYKTAASLPTLQENLTDYLKNTGYRQELWYNYTPEQLMNKLFSQNVLDFMENHFWELSPYERRKKLIRLKRRR